MKKRGRKPFSSLTSEERCKRAFEQWYLTPGVKPPEHIWQMGESAILQYTAWKACWDLLQSRVSELVAS